MSLLDRLNLLIRSEISDLSSRGDNYRTTVNEVDSSLRDAKRQQIELRRAEKKLVEAIREARSKADQWEQRAVLALKSGDEELAREALIVKNRTLDEAERLRDELDEHRSHLKDIQRALEALEMKIDGAREKRSRKEKPTSSGKTFRNESSWDREMARRSAGKPSSGSNKTNDSPFEDIGDDSPTFGTDRSFNEFERMSNKIENMEAQIDAINEFEGDDWMDPRRRELEDIFSKMEKKKRTNDDLADLKKKFE